MNIEKIFVEWVAFPLLLFVGGLFRYFKSLKSMKQFSWLAITVQILGAISMGTVIYFVGKIVPISQWFLLIIAVLVGIWGESMFKHFIRTYTKIPIPD